jgi:hypothetical protein
MHKFDTRERATLDLLGAEFGDAACELSPVQIANPYDVARIEISFAT